MRTDGVPLAKQQAQRIIREETMTVVKNKCVKAVGSDDIPVEENRQWTLCPVFNTILENRRTREEQRNREVYRN